MIEEPQVSDIASHTPEVVEMEVQEVHEPQGESMEIVGGSNEYQRHWMQVAWEISGHDKQFLYMLKAENGLLNHDRQSEVVKNGIREPSFGFCQIHRGYHPNIVNDPRFFSDPGWQMQKCYELWTGGTAFYGHHRFKNNYAFQQKIKSAFKFY